jgi:hypothetical protein
MPPKALAQNAASNSQVNVGQINEVSLGLRAQAGLLAV